MCWKHFPKRNCYGLRRHWQRHSEGARAEELADSRQGLLTEHGGRQLGTGIGKGFQAEVTPHQGVGVVAGGGDGWPAAHFLFGEHYSLLLTNDWCHRNDVQLAIQDVNSQFVIMVATIVMNLDHGSWAAHKWFEELHAGATEYTQVADSTDTIHDRNFLHVVVESGIPVNDIMSEDGRAFHLRA